MRKVIAASVLVLAGCGAPPNCILVMTTFDKNLAPSTQTVIQGFRSKEQCESAGEQWYKSLGENNINKFVCLEPKL